MKTRWQAAFPGDGAVQNGLMRHLAYAMKYAPSDLPAYRDRVAEIQDRLRQMPMPQRVYISMRAQAGKALASPLDLRNEIGPAFDIVYRSVDLGQDAEPQTRIAALLTARGFHGYFEPHSGDFTELALIDQWTLGERARIEYSEADKQVLATRVRAIYNRDYIDTWQRSLNRLEVADFDDIAQAVSVLGSVISPAAPLRRLVETVRDNTSLQTPDARLPQPEAAAPAAAAKALQMGAIARPFVALTEVLRATENKPSYLDESTAAVARVHDVVKGVQDSPDPGKAALGVVLDRFALKGDDAIGNLQRIAVGMPEPLNRQVKKLADESAQVLVIEALKELERRWNTEVYRFYDERLANRYPFDPASRADASLEDFTVMFGPRGRLAQFKEQYLKLFLEDNQEALYSERHGGHLVRMDVLKQLEAADRIQDAFFNSRGALNVQFSVEPLGLSPTRRSSVLGVEGQLIPYSHGAANSVVLIWPNNLGANTESRITLVGGSGTSSSLAFRGPWSLFRLMSQARLDAVTATSVDLSFSASDGAMRYRVSAEKSNNPFTHPLFDGFALPRTLLADLPGKGKAVPVADAGRAKGKATAPRR
jgi:type VI secretion system protein ImpL